MAVSDFFENIARRIAGNISTFTVIVTWISMLILIAVGIAGSWNLIEMPYSDFTLGFLMILGGFLIWVETAMQQGVTALNQGDFGNPSLWTGLTTGTFGMLYGYGLITEALIPVVGMPVAEVTGGVQGGILFFMFVNLLAEGLSNHTVFGDAGSNAF